MAAVIVKQTSAQWPYIIGTSHSIVTTIDSYFDGSLLEANIPLTAGRIVYDDTATLRRRLTLTVPSETEWKSYVPGNDPKAPLASYGQILHVSTGIRLPAGEIEVLNHGQYIITDWEYNEADQLIDVTAQDLVRLIEDYRLYADQSPELDATYPSEFETLIAGIVDTNIDENLSKAKVNPLTIWERERVKNLDRLCQAWPARWFIDDDGKATATKPYEPITDKTIPDVVFIDGTNGTVVDRRRQGGRDRLKNAIVVDGKVGEDDTPAPHAVAEITDPNSPIYVEGPYGRVPRFYSSDLITTDEQAQTTAKQQLAIYSTLGRAETLSCLPNPAIELGDVARVHTRISTFLGRISAITLPLTASDGAMEITVTTLPADTDIDSS